MACFFCIPFLLGNLNQPAGYTVPMVTQGPPIQPLPVRPGVIAQVRHILNHGFFRPVELHLSASNRLLCSLFVGAVTEV